jgi:hypothetical protein
MIMIRTENITIDRILDEFQQGDLDTRLCMFLYYRELREEFTRMQEDEADDSMPAACTVLSRTARSDDRGAGAAECRH